MGLYRWDQDRHDLLHLALSVDESITSRRYLSLRGVSQLVQSLRVPEMTGVGQRSAAVQKWRAVGPTFICRGGGSGGMCVCVCAVIARNSRSGDEMTAEICTCMINYICTYCMYVISDHNSRVIRISTNSFEVSKRVTRALGHTREHPTASLGYILPSCYFDTLLILF